MLETAMKKLIGLNRRHRMLPMSIKIVKEKLAQWTLDRTTPDVLIFSTGEGGSPNLPDNPSWSRTSD